MTAEQAQKLGSYVLDAGLDACILTLGRGDEFCVRIVGSQCWHLWSFADWNAWCKEAKKQRRKERKASSHSEQIGIDPEVSYHLAFA